MSQRTCSVEGCSNPVRCCGVCNTHYHKLKISRKPKAPCACGCGVLTHQKFLPGHNTRLLPAAEQARRGQLNDGSALRDRGEGKTYRKVGQRHEHRAVAEQKLGRPLLPGEIVHHVNEQKRDNNPDNIEVTTRPDHIRKHLPGMQAARKAKLGY